MGVLDSLLPGIAGGLGGVISSGINYFSQQRTNEANEQLMRESWARDDNAVQRRAADLKAAGFNPLLAAGSAASNSGPIRLEAPQVQGNVVGDAMAAARAGQDIATSQAQRDLTAQQARKAGAEADYLEGTLAARTAGTSAQMRVAVDTAQQLINQAANETDISSWKVASAAIDARVAAAMNGLPIQDNQGNTLEPSDVLQILSNNRVKAASLTNNQTAANIAAMAATIARGQLDAEFYKKVGVPPAMVDMISEVAKALSSGVGLAALAGMF